MGSTTTLPEPPVLPEEAVQDQVADLPALQPPYAVILHNDDINGMDFVISVLRKVFGYSTIKAARLMWQAHTAGRSVLWTGSFEVAEFKALQVQSCGPDPHMVHRGAAALNVSVEPIPT